MQTCNRAKNTQNNGIALESSKNPRGQNAMPTPNKVTPIRGDDLTLVDNKQAAKILEINEKTLTNWRSSGKSPKYVKVGRCVRYRLSDLTAWIEANSRNHTGEVA